MLMEIPIEAIAITSVNNSYGTWQYSTNGGTSWTPISNHRVLKWFSFKSVVT